MSKSIFIHRLIVLGKNEQPVFNQTFKQGVNLISGQSSTGKSTIMQFLVYGLGGKASAWTTEAKKCKKVIVDVSFNKNRYFFYRNLNNDSIAFVKANGDENIETIISKEKQIHLPTPVNHIAKNVLKWLDFNNDIINYLCTDDVEIQMQHILNLIYIDQKTPVNSFLNYTDIGNSLRKPYEILYQVMIGLFNLEKLKNQDRIEDLEKIIKRFNFLKNNNISNNILAGIESSVSLIAAKEKQTKRLKTLQDEAEKLTDKEFQNKFTSTEESNFKLLERERANLIKEISILKDDIQKLRLDIVDSQYFISEIEKKQRYIQESNQTREFISKFGLMRFAHCPQCLTVVKESVSNSHCHLCKEEVGDANANIQIISFEEQTNMQIKESKDILIRREKQLLEKEQVLQEKEQVFKNKELEIKPFLEKPIYINSLLKNKLVEMGEITNNLKFIDYKLQIAIETEKNILQIENAKKAKEKLTTATIAIEQAMASLRNQVEYAISKIAINFLKKGLVRQNEFENAKQLKININENCCELDNQRHFSASSDIYLKNAARFALLFASLENEIFAYPNFIMCDNMSQIAEPERMLDFEDLIIQTSKDNAHIPHQIIMTSLGNIENDMQKYQELFIGDFYTAEHKTLKIDSENPF